MPQLESAEEIARAKAAESAQARVRELEAQLAAVRAAERAKVLEEVREALLGDEALFAVACKRIGIDHDEKENRNFDAEQHARELVEAALATLKETSATDGAGECEALQKERDGAVWWLRDIPKSMREEASEAPSEQAAEILGRWATRLESISVEPPTEADIDWAQKVLAERDPLPATPEVEEGVSGDAEDCKRCGRTNTIWSAQSPLWNAVMRGGSIDGEPKYGDMVCAACFMQVAEEQGIATRFRVIAEVVNVDLETVTPSGRVWDEDLFLWQDPAERPGTWADDEVVEFALNGLETAATPDPSDTPPANYPPFTYGHEQGQGLFPDALDALLADLRGLLHAANPGQEIRIERNHIDQDGRYFTARVLPHLTEVQIKAAAQDPDTPPTSVPSGEGPRCGGSPGKPRLVEAPGVDEPWPMQVPCSGCKDCSPSKDAIETYRAQATTDGHVELISDPAGSLCLVAAVENRLADCSQPPSGTEDAMCEARNAGVGRCELPQGHDGCHERRYGTSLSIWPEPPGTVGEGDEDWHAVARREREIVREQRGTLAAADDLIEELRVERDSLLTKEAVAGLIEEQIRHCKERMGNYPAGSGGAVGAAHRCRGFEHLLTVLVAFGEES